MTGVIRWLSIRAYCERYDVNRKTVYKFMDAGLLASWQVGRVLRVEDRPPTRRRHTAPPNTKSRQLRQT